MNSKNLEYNIYKGNILSLQNNQKIMGMHYGVARLSLKQIKGLIECVYILAAAFPIPKDLRERLENRILPRFYEIKEKKFSNELGIEFSKLDHKDLLYGLNSISICKLLKDKEFNPDDLRHFIEHINFLEERVNNKLLKFQ
jgi:hypothetical protein